MTLIKYQRISVVIRINFQKGKENWPRGNAEHNSVLFFGVLIVQFKTSLWLKVTSPVGSCKFYNPENEPVTVNSARVQVQHVGGDFVQEVSIVGHD